MKKSTKATVAPSRPIAAEERKWRAEDAMRTIMRAEEIRKDTRLMADVKRMAKEQASKLNGLCRKGK